MDISCYSLLALSNALKDVLGRPFQHQGRWIVVVYHPSYVLRVPGEDIKAQAFQVMVDGLREAARLGA